MTTGKTSALTTQTFVCKIMSLLLNMLSRLVITFLPRSKCLLISWLQSPSAVILEPQKIKSDTVSTVSPSIPHEVMRPDAMIFVFWMLSYLRLLIFLPAILIPACVSSSPAFLMMYSAYKLIKQGDNIQPWRTSFPIWNQSVVPFPVLTVACWPAYRYLSRQVRWSGIPISFKNFPQFAVIHSVKGFGVVSKGEVDVFLGTLLLFQWSSRCWQFDLWFLCLF